MGEFLNVKLLCFDGLNTHTHFSRKKKKPVQPELHFSRCFFFFFSPDQLLRGKKNDFQSAGLGYLELLGDEGVHLLLMSWILAELNSPNVLD